jgi:hypothetical protein
MTGPDRENRRLWDAWSDEHQALWNAGTAQGGLPPVYSPLPEPAAMADWQAARLSDREELAVVELGCGGGQGTVGLARDGVETGSVSTFPSSNSATRPACGTSTTSTPSSSPAT